MTHDAEGARDLEALAALVQRRGAGRENGVDAVAAGRDQHAELVAAEPVGVADVADSLGQPRREPHQQAVAGGVAEGVVVLLEAVEVEQEQGARVARASPARAASRDRPSGCAGCGGR